MEEKLSFRHRIVQQVRHTAPFFPGMTAFIVLAGMILLLFPKASIHIFINQFHSSIFDFVFCQITFMGDGLSATIIVIILLFIRFRYAIMMAISNITCSIIIQSLKHFLFEGSVRPYEFFKGIYPLYLIPGVEVYSFHSFPSGHSATIFTTCVLLCLMVKRKSFRLLLFFLALLVAFSRVYLSQHFLSDIYAGSMIGVAAAYITAAYCNEERTTPSWFNQSLISLYRKR